MNAIKIILCSMIGTLLAFSTINAKTYLEKQYFKNSATQNMLETQKVNFTIKNRSERELSCYNLVNNKTHLFLTLNPNEERNYKDIEEKERIGCDIKIDESSTTMLNWFKAENKIYTASFEKVPCPECKTVGITERWGTIITTTNE